MLNIMMGPPGAGKSYEAVNYHAIPALKGGCWNPSTKRKAPRQVVTNLPIKREVVAAVLGEEVADHLVVVSDSPGRRWGSSAKDYASTWRGPDGKGPLYIIDEAHKVLGQKGVPQPVLEWYAEHRHYGADVLLITQAYGKIHRQLVDMCQVLYRTRKALGLGTSKGYIRKVQDGPRGAVLSQEVRRYTAKGYAWYTSHTHSNAAVMESSASDMKSIFARWPFLAFGVVAPIAAYMVATRWDSLNILKPQSKAQPVHSVGAAPAPQASHGPQIGTRVPVSAAAAPSSPPAAPPPPPKVEHPFSGRQLHSLGEISYGGETIAVLQLSQNGQPGVVLTSRQMAETGYTVTVTGHCAARVEYGGDLVGWAVCDRPSVGLPTTSPSPG